MNKKLTGILVCVLLIVAALSVTGASIFTGINSDAVGNFNDNEINGNGTESDEYKEHENPAPAPMAINNWRMFRHDPEHTGFSTSGAPETNYTIWTNSTSGGSWNTITSFAIVDDYVYFGGGSDGKLYSLEAASGDEQWVTQIGAGITSSPARFLNKVCFGSDDGKVHCLSTYNGVEVWSFATGYNFVKSSPTVKNGRVYFGSGVFNTTTSTYDGVLHSLYSSSGVEIWNFTIPNGLVFSSPAVFNAKVYFGSANGRVYCLNIYTGVEQWNYATGDSIESSPAIQDGKLYIGSDDGKIYCLDANDGSEIWNKSLSYSIKSSPAVVDGRVYIGIYEKVYCFNGSNGDQIWEKDLPVGTYGISSPAIADGKLYIGSDSGYIYCLDIMDNGTVLWNYLADGPVYSSPSIARGQVFMGSSNGTVYCFRDEIPPNYLTIGNTTASPGDTGHLIPIYGKWNGELDWIQVYILYDTSKIEITNVSVIGSIEENPYEVWWGTSWGILDFYLWYTENGSGIPGTGLPPGEGLLCNLVVNVSHSAPGGTTPLNFITWWGSGINFVFTSGVWYTPDVLTDGYLTVVNFPPSTPAQPSGPTNGDVGAEYTFSTNATDPEEQQIRYGWDWNGDMNVDEWTDFYDSGEDISINHMWTTVGMFDIRVKARDSSGDESNWSLPSVINITNEPPNTPAKPSGPTSGLAGIEYTFSTNATDPNGGQIKYGWDWNGDLNVDEWTGFYDSGENISRGHSWGDIGTFDIRVKAQDPAGDESNWSLPSVINITNEPPNTPAKPSGPTFGVVGAEYNFTTNTTDPEGHQIQYGWDWNGDQIVDKRSGASASLGEMFYDGFETGFSLWDENGATNWYRYTNPIYAGSYAARCDSGDTYLTSDNIDTSTYSMFGISFWFYDKYIDDNEALLQLWNGTTYVTIQDLNIVQHTEHQWTSYETVIEDQEYMSSTFRVRFDGASLDSSEYLYIDEFKVGAFHNSGENISVNNTWFERGLYNVSVRAKDQYNATSQWSELLSIYIHNDEPEISQPDGPIALKIGESAIYVTSAEDPNGHQIQYRFDWDDGIYTEWTPLVDSGQTLSLSHSWISPGTHMIKAQAKDEFGLASNWSEALTITVTAGDWWPWWSMFRHDPLNAGSSPSPGPNSNSIIWTSTIEGGVQSSAPAVVDNKVYITVDAPEPKIYCLNAINGEILWVNSTEEFGRSPVVADGKVIVGIDDMIYCWDAETGDEIWKTTVNGGIYLSPVVDDDKIYVGSWYGRIYCLNISNGAKLWNNNLGYDVHFTMSSPAVADGKIFIGSTEGFNGNVYCFDESNGETLWTFPAGSDVKSSPAFAYSNIYVGADNGKVYCLDAATGEKNWEFETSAGFYVRSSPAVANGYVYIGSADHKIYCLYALNGTKKWEFDTGTFVYSSPIVADDKVYVGHLTSPDKNIICLNATTGIEIWDYSTGAGTWSSPAIAFEKLYVGGNDKIICFGANQPPVTPNPPSGPTEGTVGVEYTFSVEGADPDNDEIFCKWDWGDGSSSNWLGPYTSGETIYASHTWTLRGDYMVRVKIKDEHGSEGDWSEPLPLHIRGPLLEIGDIAGGIRIGTEIRNIGDAQATDIFWKITFERRFPSRIKDWSGVISSIQPGESETIRTDGLVFGLGRVWIKITAEAAYAETVEKEATGFIFLFYVIIFK